MDKNSVAAIACSAEDLWICRGIKPPLLPDKPVVTDPDVKSEDQHLRRFNSATPATR